MNFKEYSANIAKKANVDEGKTRRILRAHFEDIKTQLDKGENVILPSFGRLVSQKRPNGARRVILTRPSPKKAPPAKEGPKAKPTRQAKNSASKPRPVAKKRPPARKKA